MLDRIIITIAKIISVITSPIIMPTYGMLIALWGTYLVFAPASTRIQVLLFSFAVTAMVPVIVIYLLSKFGIIKNATLNDRHDRPYVYAAATMAYFGISVYLSTINSPQWLSIFMLAAAIAAVVTMIINFKWKISGHATSIGALAAFTFFLYYKNITLHNNSLLFFIIMLVAGAVMTSRLILNHHSLGQVVAGFFNGAFWVTAIEMICAE